MKRRLFQALAALLIVMILLFTTLSITGCSEDTQNKDSGCSSCDNCSCDYNSNGEDTADNSGNVGT